MPKFSLSSLPLRLLAISLSLAATGCGDDEKKDDGGAADTSGSADTSDTSGSADTGDGSGSFVLPTDAEKAAYEAATAANLTAAAALPRRVPVSGETSAPDAGQDRRARR